MSRLIYLIAATCCSLTLSGYTLAEDENFHPQDPVGTTTGADTGAFQELKVTGEKDSANPAPTPKIMDEKFYSKAVEACKDETDREKLEDCVKKAMQDDSAVATFLQDNEQVQISNDPLEHLKTQAMTSMTTFLDKRLQETLHGEGMASVANHDTFYGLYQAQLSKLAVKIITDFCMDLAPVFVVKNNNQCKLHTDLIRVIGRTGKPATKDEKTACENRFTKDKVKCENELDVVRSENLAYALGKEQAPDTVADIFKGCMNSIPALCKADDDNYKHAWSTCCLYSPPPPVPTPAPDNPCRFKDAEPSAAYAETRTRACAVAANLRLLASRIKMMEELKAAMENPEMRHAGASFEASTVFGDKCIYGLGKCDKKTATINDLTTLTSEELEDEKKGAGLKKALDSDLDTIKAACNHVQGKEPSDKCKALLYTLDHEKEIDKIEQEHNAKTRLVMAKIEKMNDRKEVEAYLLSEGMSKEQASLYLKNLDLVGDQHKTLDQIKDEIAETYKRERENVVKSIRDQINDKTYLSDDQVKTLEKDRTGKQNYFYGQRTSKGQMEKDNVIREQERKAGLFLAQQTFTNMVSSYFTLEPANQDKNDKKDKKIYGNPFDAKRELAGSYFIENKDKEAIENAMNERLKKMTAPPEDEFAGGSNLPVDFIFGIIDGKKPEPQP